MVSTSLKKHTMQDILDYSLAKSKELHKLDFYKFMQNETIHPIQRFSWAPCYAHLGMSFPDILKYQFRREPAEDKIQELLNQHTYEEENHFLWYLEDIDKLGLNEPRSFTETLNFIWNQDTIGTTTIIPKVSQLTSQADSVVLMAIMTMIEDATDIFFSTSNKVAGELKSITNQDYHFFGERHWNSEVAHNLAKQKVQDFLASQHITEEQKIKAFEAIDETYKIIESFLNGLLNYARKYPVSPV